LVLDADPAVHKVLEGLLRRGDRSIEDAYDSDQALDLLRRLPCEVVVGGPESNGGGDGRALLRQVRSLRPEARVILTGEANPARAVAAIRDRAYCYFHKPFPASQLADMVQQALDASAWRDDLRVVSARPDWCTLDVRSKLEAAERATQLVREMTADAPCGPREDIASAFRELLINGIEHGAGSDPRKRVRATLIRTARSVVVEIEDPGKGFSLEHLPHAAITNPEDSPTRHVEVRARQGNRPGGFGILMARNMVDELVYNEKRNAVLFVKYLK
jgi:CheY-like chemotaxis protein/anti-sigma regulatory factor (Ser/Thr protein kinase)